MHTSNFKKDFSTVAGAVFIVASLVYMIAPMFLEKEIETDYMILLAGAVIGLGLMFAPNDLYGLLKRKADKL